MSALFALGAFVQLNDPDPLPWIAVYLAASAASLLSVFRSRAWLLAAPTGIVACCWAVALRASMTEMAPLSSLFDEIEMKSIVIEETREVLGLGLIALWMLVAWFFSRRAHDLESPCSTARS